MTGYAVVDVETTGLLPGGHDRIVEIAGTDDSPHCAPHPAVTQRDVLLVAADPDDLSGKARKAVDYGIPIVTEQAFARMLDDFTARSAQP